MSEEVAATAQGHRFRKPLQRYQPATWLAWAMLAIGAGALVLVQASDWLLSAAGFLLPYELSPTVLLAIGGTALLYVAGMYRDADRGEGERTWQHLAFFLGLGLTYMMLQTHFDYLAQHMFWVHRLQHLVLHHLAPLLLVLAAPRAVLLRGLPTAVRTRVVEPFTRSPIVQAIYRVVQQPFIAMALFVGLIYVWLIPGLHYDAMLSVDLYKAMNWSMVIDGILFWWAMLDSHPGDGRRPAYGLRMIVLWLSMIPQIALGAYIALNSSELYEVYNVCGRVWSVDPLLDQRIGGLLLWIPGSMMSALVALLVLARWYRDRRERTA